MGNAGKLVKEKPESGRLREYEGFYGTARDRLLATQRRAATKDSRRTRLSDVSVVCVRVYGDLPDDLCCASNVGPFCELW